ncbi:uncharacterized protein HD556DRAFT_1370223 [Suillus plorans]|uniref:Hydrophobin n=1 Tax=Suillus plorans TaxID=116603 RepID=A0A9P7ARW4_9AGAM|nr:uncharacterized protein HD556DRAFT_1370223 [Suillus plorans]KAG1794415.1 hypothetical protein HD556DRAFT_1370223 [Suillus plorans]
MHFSFLRVVAVVAALTRSMSVTAQLCGTVGNACGKSSPEGTVCCGDLLCNPAVSMSRSLCIRNSTPRLTFAPCTSPEVLPRTARNLESPDELGRLSMSQ